MSTALPRNFSPAMQMVELFGKVRDEWIEQDLAGWLACC